MTRTKEEALAMIEEFRRRLVAGEASFSELAARESHCSSARNGGDLGEFGRGQMQRAFEDATYALQVRGWVGGWVRGWVGACGRAGVRACGGGWVRGGGERTSEWLPTLDHPLLLLLHLLQVGELSQPVFSDSGVHLILRTA